MQKKIKILIIGDEADSHIAAVRWALRELGHSTEIWSWTDFPSVNKSSIIIDNKSSSAFELWLSKGRIAEGFDVVWNRRVSNPVRTSSSANADWPIISRESISYMRSLMRLVDKSGVRWVNSFDAGLIAGDKAVQLQAAKAVGFIVPSTIISNDFEKIKDFYTSLEGRMIYKAFLPGAWIKSDGTSRTLKTALVPDVAFQHADAFTQCPGIYQELIEKDFEIRVNVMGENVLAARIDSQRDGRKVDWRYDLDQATLPVSPFALPTDVSRRCIEICRTLGLAFGCIDLVVNRSGEFVFLEINQAGQFLWLEDRNPDIKALYSFCEFLVGPENIPLDKKFLVTLSEFDRSEECAKWEAMSSVIKGNSPGLVIESQA